MLDAEVDRTREVLRINAMHELVPWTLEHEAVREEITELAEWLGVAVVHGLREPAPGARNRHTLRVCGPEGFDVSTPDDHSSHRHVRVPMSPPFPSSRTTRMSHPVRRRRSPTCCGRSPISATTVGTDPRATRLPGHSGQQPDSRRGARRKRWPEPDTAPRRA